jgi:hypothetical protein
MLQSDGFGPAYRDLARREPVFARLITVYGRPDPSNGTTGDAPGPASSRPCCCPLWDNGSLRISPGDAGHLRTADLVALAA